jgi:hypothetical protein
MTRKAIAIHDDAKHRLNDDLFAVAKTVSHEAARLFRGVKFTILASSLHYDAHNNCYTVLIEYEDKQLPTQSRFAAAMNNAAKIHPVPSH